MPITGYSDSGVSPRSDSYAYGTGRRKMPRKNGLAPQKLIEDTEQMRKAFNGLLPKLKRKRMNRDMLALKAFEGGWDATNVPRR